MLGQDAKTKKMHTVTYSFFLKIGSWRRLGEDTAEICLAGDEEIGERRGEGRRRRPFQTSLELQLELWNSLSVALKIFYLERMCIRKERASPMVDISKRYWKRDSQILHNFHLWKIISGHINKEVLLSSSFFVFLHVSSAFPIFMFTGINARRWATSLDYQNLLKNTLYRIRCH